MRKLLDWIKSSPTPKPKYRLITIPLEEYELLQIAAWNKGRRAEAQKKLKLLNAGKLNDGL